MYVHSTYEVNTHQQQNPFVSQTIGHASPGKPASGLSFKEQFNLYSQKAGAPTVSRQAENQVAGIFWGFLPLLRVQTKPEPTPDDEES